LVSDCGRGSCVAEMLQDKSTCEESVESRSFSVSELLRVVFYKGPRALFRDHVDKIQRRCRALFRGRCCFSPSMDVGYCYVLLVRSRATEKVLGSIEY
jgi:hypothetical protein